MDKLIESLVMTSPSLIGGIVILSMLLRYMERREKAMTSIANDFRESVRDQAEQCHAVQRESTTVQMYTMRALVQLSESVNQLNQTITKQAK